MRWLHPLALLRSCTFSLKVLAFERSSSPGARGDTNLLAQRSFRGRSVVDGVSVTAAYPCTPYVCRGLPSLLCLVIMALYYVPVTEEGVVAVAEAAKQGRPVTYGSAISLVHAATGYKLFSGKISWGSGSGQQAVTAMPSEERPATGNVLWTVTVPPGSNKQVPLDSRELQKQIGTKSIPAAVEGSETDPIPALPTDGEAGLPVRCGSVVALEHATSAGRLQAVGAPSPLSNNREVSAGESKEDRLTGFKVLCGSSSAQSWNLGESVILEHEHLKTTLQAKKEHKFTQQNCGRGCPIAGHIEVSVGNEKPRSTWSWGAAPDQWKAEAGIMVGKEGDGLLHDDELSHDEL